MMCNTMDILKFLNISLPSPSIKETHQSTKYHKGWIGEILQH